MANVNTCVTLPHPQVLHMHSHTHLYLPLSPPPFLLTFAFLYVSPLSLFPFHLLSLFPPLPFPLPLAIPSLPSPFLPSHFLSLLSLSSYHPRTHGYTQGGTALHAAVEGEHEGIVELLLKANINPDLPDEVSHVTCGLYWTCSSTGLTSIQKVLGSNPSWIPEYFPRVYFSRSA